MSNHVLVIDEPSEGLKLKIFTSDNFTKDSLTTPCIPQPSSPQHRRFTQIEWCLKLCPSKNNSWRVCLLVITPRIPIRLYTRDFGYIHTRTYAYTPSVVPLHRLR